jgi:hypothetical protein
MNRIHLTARFRRERERERERERAYMTTRL